jgi:hypothetical protein
MNIEIIVIDKINIKIMTICFHNLFFINNNKNKIGKNFIETAKASGIVERVYFFCVKKYKKISRNIHTKLSKLALSTRNKNGKVKNVKIKVFITESNLESSLIK